MIFREMTYNRIRPYYNNSHGMILGRKKSNEFDIFEIKVL